MACESSSGGSGDTQGTTDIPTVENVIGTDTVSTTDTVTTTDVLVKETCTATCTSNGSNIGSCTAKEANVEYRIAYFFENEGILDQEKASCPKRNRTWSDASCNKSFCGACVHDMGGIGCWRQNIITCCDVCKAMCFDTRVDL